MNSKILVELHVPKLNSIYNVYFPVNLKIGEVIDLLNKGLFDLSNELYQEENNFLYDEDGNILDFNLLVYQTILKNGSKVILL